VFHPLVGADMVAVVLLIFASTDVHTLGICKL